MRYLEKPREFDRLPLVALRSLLILSASSVSLCLGVPAQAQSAVPLAAVEPPPVVRTIGTDGTDIAAPTPPPPDVLLPDVAPILQDEEFRDAIPPTSAEDDPELDRPLESIHDFEPRQRSEEPRAGTDYERTWRTR